MNLISSRFFRIATLVLLSICSLQGVCFAEEAPAPIVRLSQAPQLNGKIEEWPFPALVKMSSAAGKAEMRLGYDETCFYASAEVADLSPWKNNPAREEEAIKGGDAVAFYFQTRNGDEQRVLVAPGKKGPQVYVFRAHSAQKKPYTFTSPAGAVTFEYVGPLEGAKAFVKQHPEGYVLQIALPWKSLGMAPAPRAFKFDAQVIFSDPAGVMNAGAAWWHASEGPGLTIEDLPTEAQLYPDTWGRAELMEQAPVAVAGSNAAVRTADANKIHLNLPRAGKLSLLITDKEGAILRELVSAKKFAAGAQEIPWDGRDRYGEPLPLGTYQWKALLFDGMGVKFMGSVGNSGRPPYRTPDGLGSLGGQHGCFKSLAADKEGIYMAGAGQEGPPAMRKINAQSGKALWMRSAGTFQAVVAIAAEEEMACLISAGGQKLNYLTELVRINPQTGKDKPMGSKKARLKLEVPPDFHAIAGLAIAGGRAWFSLPKEACVRSVDLRTGDAGPTYPIPSPAGIARLDATHLLVCSGNTVQVLDLANGQHRPLIAGRLTEPRNLAIGPDGKIYVSDLGESQQIKVFSATGQPLATWGRPGGKPAWMAQYDPLAFRNLTGVTVGPDGNLWLAEEDSTPNRFVKLLSAGKWLEDFYGPVAYNTFGPDLDDFSTVYYNSGGNSRFPFFIETKVDYAKYQADPNNPAAAWSIRSIYDLSLAADGTTHNDVMSTVASTGYGHVFAFKATNGKRYLFRPSKENRASTPIGAGLWVWNKDRWLPCAFLSGDTKQPSWTDANDDGLVQPEETYPTTPVQRYAWIDRDLTLHGDAGKLAPAGINGQGAPNYKDGKFTSYLADGSHVQGFVSREIDGATYYVTNLGPHRHLSFWDRATENRLTKVEAGRVQWIAGTHTPVPTDTEFSTASGIAGVVDGIVLAHNIEPANYPAFTTDGFALGNAMVGEDGTRPSVGPNVICIENFTGLFVKDPQSGKPVLFAVSSGDDRILEVTGPGQTTRLEGTVALAQVTGLAQSPVIPYETAIGNTQACIAIDGEAYEWKSDLPGVSLSRGGQIVGDVRLRRDAGALYLFATVLDSAALENGGGLGMTLSRQADGVPAATFDFKVVRDQTGKWTGKATLLKANQPVDAARVRVAATERWRGLGYRIEAEIPIDLLPELSTPKSQTFRREDKNKRSAKNGKAEVGLITETRPDLTGPLFLSLQLQGGAKDASLPGSSGKPISVKVP